MEVQIKFRIENPNNEQLLRTCLKLTQLNYSIVILSKGGDQIANNIRFHLKRNDDVVFKSTFHYYDSDKLDDQFVTISFSDITLFLSVAQAKELRNSLSPRNIRKS